MDDDYCDEDGMHGVVRTTDACMARMEVKAEIKEIQ